MKDLNKKYTKTVNKYCKVFQKKYDILFDGWVGNRAGEIACFADYFFDFREVKYCIDNDMTFDYLNDWYYFSIEVHGKMSINFESYCKLRQDYEFKNGFGFNIKDFEKELILMRVK